VPFTDASRLSWTMEAVIGLSGVEILMTRREVAVGVIPKRRKDSAILTLYLERKDHEIGFRRRNGVGNQIMEYEYISRQTR
jgi:hypothetical protein